MPVLKSVLGLDLGSHSLKAVELQQTLRGVEVVQVRSLPRDPGEDPTEQVRQLLQLHRPGIEHVVAALPGDAISSRRLSFPFRDKRKLTQAVPFAVEGDLPFDLFYHSPFSGRTCLTPDDPRKKCLPILNPLTEDSSVMRTSLIPGLMETVRYNLSYKNANLRIFELKKIYLPAEGGRLPKEVKSLTGLAMGLDGDPHWASSARPVDFYDVKGCLEDLFRLLQVKGIKFVRTEEIPYLHPGKSSTVIRGEETLGVVGEVHPETLSHYGIPGKAYLFEIDFDRMVIHAEEDKKFRPLPKFPAVHRDLSLVVEDHLEAEKVEEAIRLLKQPLIDEVMLFDVYQGNPVPQGKKSLAYRIRYQSSDPLTDDEVNRYHEKIISPKKADAGALPESRWMTQCDVIRYNLKIPQDLKQELKKEALNKGMDMGTYICGLLSGDIKRKRTSK